jgi:hypothetical protein
MFEPCDMVGSSKLYALDHLTHIVNSIYIRILVTIIIITNLDETNIGSISGHHHDNFEHGLISNYENIS